MVSRCAVPGCAAGFSRLGIGKLFYCRTGMHERPVELFWVCPGCLEKHPELRACASLLPDSFDPPQGRAAAAS